MRHCDPGQLEVVQPVARWTGDGVMYCHVSFSHTFCDQVKKRGDDYEEIKQAIGHKMIEQTCKLYPQVMILTKPSVLLREYFRLLTRLRSRRLPRP